jgi:hypothetical protein
VDGLAGFHRAATTTTAGGNMGGLWSRSSRSRSASPAPAGYLSQVHVNPTQAMVRSPTPPPPHLPPQTTPYPEYAEALERARHREGQWEAQRYGRTAHLASHAMSGEGMEVCVTPTQVYVTPTQVHVNPTQACGNPTQVYGELISAAKRAGGPRVEAMAERVLEALGAARTQLSAEKRETGSLRR